MLTKEEIDGLVSGSVRSWITEDGYIAFSRFTEEQAFWHIETKGRPLQPKGSAGMFLELSGDVRRISFSYKIERGSSRKIFGIDVLEDGVKHGEIVRELLDVKQLIEGEFSYEPTKPCRLTLVFPNLGGLHLKNVEIEGTYEPVKRKRKLYIAGDSITQGYDAIEPYHSYANRLTAAMDAACINQAIGGDRFDVGNLNHMPDFKPDAVVINYGTNDWARETEVEVKADEYLKRLSEIFRGIPTFVIEPIWRATEGVVKEKTGYTIQNVRDIVKKTALRYGFTVIPGIDLVPHDPELFSDRALHPNDAGFEYYSTNLIREIQMRAPELFQ